MSDRITYKRLVSTAEFEHLSIEISKECQIANGDAVRDIVEQVDAWAKLAKRKSRLERDLEYADLEMSRILEWHGEKVDESDPSLKGAVVRIEKIRHDLTDLQEEWA